MVRGPRLCRRRSFFPTAGIGFVCLGRDIATVFTPPLSAGPSFRGRRCSIPGNVCEGARAANLFLDFGPRSKEPQGWVSDVLVPVVAFTRGHPEHAVPRGGRVEARFETLPMVLLESSLQSREVFCSTPVFGRGQEVPDLGALPHKIAEAVAIQVECGLGHDCFALSGGVPIGTVNMSKVFSNTFHEDNQASKFGGPGTSIDRNEPSGCRMWLVNLRDFAKRDW